MSFLLDTNICSEYLKNERRLFSRFQQHAGNLFISRLSVAELYAWTNLTQHPKRRQDRVEELLETLYVVEFDDACAHVYGRLRAELPRAGISCPSVDLMIASTALVGGLTLVTHNLRDFNKIPNLSLVDWLSI